MNNTTPIKILTAAVLLTFGFALTANAALINKGVTEMNHEYTVSDTLSARQQVIPLIAASMASSQMDKLNAALNQGLDAGLTINEAKEILMLQGDRRHAGTPEDGVISREQIAQVLVTALSNDAAKNKTFELVAERGEAQQDLTLLFAELRNDNPQKNDGVFDIDNMPLTEEPECVINDLNLYSKNSKI